MVLGAILIAPSSQVLSVHAESAHSVAFPNATQEAQIAKGWAASADFHAWNVNPELAEDLGSVNYSQGTKGYTYVYDTIQAYPLRTSRFPQSFMIVGLVTATGGGKSVQGQTLTVFSRASAKQHWKATTSVYLTNAPDFGKAGTPINELTSSQTKKLRASPDTSTKQALAGVNNYLRHGTSSTLLPDDAWFSSELTYLQSLAPDGGSYTTQSAMDGFPSYALRGASGATMIVFTFKMANTESIPQGYQLTTNFFPNQQLQSETDTWYWTVALTDPVSGPGSQLSVAGESFGPIAASALTTAGETLFYGPY
jgi:hypothetical protein